MPSINAVGVRTCATAHDDYLIPSYLDLCLQRYEKPWYSVEQAQALLAKLGRSLPPSAQTLFLVQDGDLYVA
jgi:hypothetical protein